MIKKHSKIITMAIILVRNIRRSRKTEKVFHKNIIFSADSTLLAAVTTFPNLEVALPSPDDVGSCDISEAADEPLEPFWGFEEDTNSFSDSHPSARGLTFFIGHGVMKST